MSHTVRDRAKLSTREKIMKVSLGCGARLRLVLDAMTYLPIHVPITRWARSNVSHSRVDTLKEDPTQGIRRTERYPGYKQSGSEQRNRCPGKGIVEVGAFSR